ncbi:MAG: twin-arginine translocation signal domain-containing protein [Anaerolineales bacterium]|nr:twin-arginine translocation signal domain-containing protein [Anaerolineales bacterium]
MTQEPSQPIHTSRRNFLKAALLTSGAAVATGAGAALLVPSKTPATTPPVVSVSSPAGAGVSGAASAAGATTAATTAVNPTELMERLASSQAENMRLQAELDAALRRLQTLEQGQEPSQAVNLMQEELTTANAQVTALAGLVALYDELEKVDVQGLFTQGTTAVSDSFQALLDQFPTLNEGLALSDEAITTLEMQVPLLENGRSWLDTHLADLDRYYQVVERMLNTAVKRAGPVLDMLQSWFDDILKWLPFGMGENAQNVMNALSDFVQQAPVTLRGLDTNIAQPLDMWLKREAGQTDTPLVQNVVKPVREKALKPAAQTMAQAEAAHAIYQEKLVAQLETQLAGRAIIQQMIAEYRQKNSV